MNWKIRPPRQFVPIGPQDWPQGANCLRGRIFQNTPPLGSVLLQYCPGWRDILEITLQMAG